MFSFLKRKRPPYAQSPAETWRDQWRSLVPPECLMWDLSFPTRI